MPRLIRLNPKLKTQLRANAKRSGIPTGIYTRMILDAAKLVESRRRFRGHRAGDPLKDQASLIDVVDIVSAYLRLDALTEDKKVRLKVKTDLTADDKNDTATTDSQTRQKRSGAEVLKELKDAGVIGTFSDRPDSLTWARELRKNAERRAR